MTYARRFFWQLMVAAFIFSACRPMPPVHMDVNQDPPPACQEDAACWDWRTMGNRCGRDSYDEPIRCYDEAGNEIPGGQP